MALETWKFREHCNIFSGMNNMDQLCWETRLNIQDFIPHVLLNPFEYAPSSLGFDLQTYGDVLISKPEAMIAQFDDMFAGNTFNGTDESETSSTSCNMDIYPSYQRHGCLLSPLTTNFMNFGLDFKETAAEDLELHEELVASVPNIIFPWHIRDEEEKRRFRVENLLKALAEALEREASELVRVILNRLRGRVSLTGNPLERAAYYFVESLRPVEAADSPGWRLMKEICSASSVTAFGALYELYPYARFAHFTANQSILECFASKNNIKKVHIVDFDVAEGLQWPPLMEALADQNIELELLRISAVKWDDEEAIISTKKTGSRLSDCAAALGVPFFYEEIALRNLKTLILSEKHSHNCLVFNMMADLPHMTCQRGKRETMEFLSVAGSLRPAILTSASSHVSDTVDYFCGMLESLEAGIPEEGLGRSVMEHIFIAPKIQRWIQSNGKGSIYNEKIGELPEKCGFSGAGAETSEESFEEAWQVVALNRGSMFYRVEKKGNKIILKWRDTPLVSASTWKCIV